MKAGIDHYRQHSNTNQGEISPQEREDHILKYAPLVKSIAERMAMRLPPHISKDELASAGIIGLLDALDKFDSQMGIKFQTYAEHRIKGAMLDELRKMDWIPRSVRKDIHRIETALLDAKTKLGRDPEDFEVAKELSVDIDTYHKMLNKAQGISLISLDAILPDGSSPTFAKQASASSSPFDDLKVGELKEVLADALSNLSEKEQLIMSLYYYDELTLKEIAKVLGLTESRISQIHSKAIIRLRAKLKSYYEE